MTTSGAKRARKGEGVKGEGVRPTLCTTGTIAGMKLPAGRTGLPGNDLSANLDCAFCSTPPARHILQGAGRSQKDKG